MPNRRRRIHLNDHFGQSSTQLPRREAGRDRHDPLDHLPSLRPSKATHPIDNHFAFARSISPADSASWTVGNSHTIVRARPSWTVAI